MPPRTPPVKSRSPNRAAPLKGTGGEDALVHELEDKEAQLASTAERLTRIKSAKAAADSERWTLSTQLREERTQFGDISGYLKHVLDEQTQRAASLEAQLAEAQAQLHAARAAVQEVAAAAEQQRAADREERQAEFEEMSGRIQAADAFLAERETMQARIQHLEAKLEQHAQQQQKRFMDLERKHVGDRELWRQHMQEAVRAAREEMAALTDQRLDASTQKTILDNEAMAAELQYQARHVQGLLSANAALRQEVEELRVAADISKKTQEELGGKALACEKAADSLLARLAAVEAERARCEHAVAELQEQLNDAREEVLSLKLKLDDQHSQVEGLGASLAAKRRELKQVKNSQSDAANFLLACLADVRQEQQLLRGQVSLALAGGAIKPGLSSQHSQQQQATKQQRPREDSSGSPGAQLASTGSAGSTSQVPQLASTGSAGSTSQVPQLLLAGLPAKRRVAALQRLLQLLGREWLEQEGVVLPVSGSPSTFTLPAGEASSAALARLASLSAQSSAFSLKGHSSSQWKATEPGLEAAPLAASNSSAGCLEEENGRRGGRSAASPELMQRLLSS